MRRSWAAVTVGVLVLVVTGVSYFLIRSTNERSSSSKGYTVWGLFHDASGLFEKSRVQTAGITVGQIDGRKLDEQTAQARITIRMLPGIKLWSNAVVTKKSASLLGEYYLEVDPGTPYAEINGERKEMRLLGEGDRIEHVREPGTMADLMNDVSTLVPILKGILEDVHKLTSGTISDIATNLNDLITENSAVLERLLRHVDHIAADVEGVTSSEAGDVKVAIRNVREITESLKGLVGTSEGEVKQTGTAMRSSIEKLQSTIDNLDKSLKNVEAITSGLKNGQGTAGRLLTDDTIANNVEEITQDASGFIKTITNLQTIVGLKTEYNVISRAFKSYVSITLAPRPDKFYLFELVEDSRGFREKVTTVTTSSQFPGPTTATTVTTSQGLRFTLMFGKRIGPVAGRFGIKESTGGFGVDLFLFSDQLTLSVDVFDTLSNKYPRVKPTVAYALWKRNLFVVAGLDDVFNFTRATAGAGGGYDLFVGGQLIFNDEDLKALLPFAGSAAGGVARR